MRFSLSALLASLGLTSCAYHPLEDKSLYAGPMHATGGAGVRATFLGNTTILVSDGSTHLLVDGFFSRPGVIRTLFGRIAPDHEVIYQELERAGVTSIDGILVGHAHHDHSLDAPVIGNMKNARVVGSESYRFVHEGGGGKMDHKHLTTLSCDRESHRFGMFTVTFVASDHVSSQTFVQKKVEGDITAPVRIPARFSDFKCGKVFAIHIAHPEAKIAVTTTAGAKECQFHGLRADVLFLGVGLISKEPVESREVYWNETVGTLNPKTVIPVHWDDFNRKLSRGLKPRSRLADDVKGAMDWVRSKGAGRSLTVMDTGDSLLIRNGKIQ